MNQFWLGLAAGIAVGVALEWIVDWSGLLPKARGATPPRLGNATPSPSNPLPTAPAAEEDTLPTTTHPYNADRD